MATNERLHVRSSELRVREEPAFVLHATPYSETSLIVQAISRHYGRLSLIAKGARRPHSPLRSVLMSLQPLILSWSGKGEVKTLTSAAWAGARVPLRDGALLCGFYINELLLKLLAREDPHESLFDAYADALNDLASAPAQAAVLRRFERLLLRELGIGPNFTQALGGGPIDPQLQYVCVPDQGVRLPQLGDASEWPIVQGQTLLDIENSCYDSPRTLQQSKALMRSLLNHALAGRTLNTRQILLDLHAL